MKRILALLAAAALFFVSCEELEKYIQPVQESLEVNTTSLSFTADGTQVQPVQVTASGKWTIVTSNNWIQPKPNSGEGDATVNVSVAYNASSEPRTGKMTVKLGSLSREVSISQEGEGAPSSEETDVVPNPAAFDDIKRSNTAYQLLVYSFADSDGDGWGDLKGVTQHLDYLDGLGVTALWLSPIHPSNSYHGYDVTDYYSIHPKLGTMEDFRELLDKAHAKGIHIYLDYVLNHTGKGHPWFTDALANPSSKYRNYYFFSANPSADYSKFPMLVGTNYQSGEWKQATSGSPKIKISKTDEAVTNGTAEWNIWTWTNSSDGKALKFVSKGDGTYYLVMEISGKRGILVRKYNSWEAGSKFGAQAGQTTLEEGVEMSLVGEGDDIWFTGEGKYKLELSNVATETLYYMGCFSDWMPDLNYGDVSVAQNNDCFKDMAASADQWIRMGVDGLRLDAVKHICGGINSYNNTSNQTLLTKWYEHCNATYKAAGHSDNIFMVAEAWDGHSVEKNYYKALTSCFEFDYGYKLRDMLNGGNAGGFVSAVSGFVADHKAIRSDAVTSFFLSNHDQNRFANEIGKNVAREKQAAAILLSGPGKPFLYQGEELGYWGAKDGGDEYVRTPIRWTRNGAIPTAPLNGKVDNSMLTADRSVEAQEDNGDSILNVYKTWSELRNTYPALAYGEMSAVNQSGSSIAAWYMTADSQKLLVVHNVSGSARSVTLSDKLDKPIALLGTASVAGKTLKLGPNSSVVFEL